MSDRLLEDLEYALERYRKKYKRDPNEKELKEFFYQLEESFYGRDGTDYIEGNLARPEELNI